MQEPNATPVENPEVDLTMDDGECAKSATSKMVTTETAASTMPETPEVIDIEEPEYKPQVIRRMMPRRNPIEKCLKTPNERENNQIGFSSFKGFGQMTTSANAPDLNQQLMAMNDAGIENMEMMNAENYTEQNINVYEPVSKVIDGEFDYMQGANPFNVEPTDGLLENEAPVSNYVNLAPFPSEFKTPEEALTAYNEYGLWHKVQFKIGFKKFTKGMKDMYCFHLVCACKKFDEVKAIK